jgi:hypothetical protein
LTVSDIITNIAAVYKFFNKGNLTQKYQKISLIEKGGGTGPVKP